MKKFTTILLIGALTLMPWQRPRAQAVPIFCVAIVVVMVAGCAVVYVHSCGPKYYCVWDPEVELQWCTSTTRKEAAVAGWQIKAGPFKTNEACDPVCHPTNIIFPHIEGEANMTIEKSTNLVNWAQCAAFVGDPECFEWSETNALSGACFYRVSYR